MVPCVRGEVGSLREDGVEVISIRGGDCLADGVVVGLLCGSHLDKDARVANAGKHLAVGFLAGLGSGFQGHAVVCEGSCEISLLAVGGGVLSISVLCLL